MVDTKAFLSLGLELRGYQRSAQRTEASREKVFRSIFGTNSMVIASVWNLLVTSPLEALRIDVAVTKPVHVLLMYRWMKSYESEMELHSAFNIAENTIRKHIRIVLNKIASLRRLKVSIADTPTIWIE
jgi:hypothetical protein